MKKIKIISIVSFVLCLLSFPSVLLSAMEKSQFTLTPEVYASFMAKSLESTLPHVFQHKKLSLKVTKVHSEKNRVYFFATTQHYKQIVEELKKYHRLPDDLQKQCNDFSKIALVDKGVEYILTLEEKNQKKLTILYDKLACSETLDVSHKIFFDGYNKYGFDVNGKRGKSKYF